MSPTRGAVACVLALAALACISSGQVRRPRTTPVTEAPSLIAMAQCRSAACVRRAYTRLAHPGIIARLVYYTKLLRLQPKNREAACGLLGSMPASRLAYSNFLYLSTYISPSETQAQLNALSGNGWYFNEHLAAAMKLCPGHLADFIHYGEMAFGNPHNDYANWAQNLPRQPQAVPACVSAVEPAGPVLLLPPRARPPRLQTARLPGGGLTAPRARENPRPAAAVCLRLCLRGPAPHPSPKAGI